MSSTTQDRQTIGTNGVDPRDVTGEVSVVVGPELRIEVRKRCHVVAVDGGLDEVLARRVAHEISGECEGTRGIIVDLDTATLLDPSGVRVLLSAVADEAGGAPVCLATSRLSARLVLARWGIAETTALFASAADALQALVLADDGYGEGWVAGAPAHHVPQR